MVTSQQILSAKKCGDIFSSDCKQDVIAEYREIARVYHPDISTDPKANEVMAKVNQLYEEALRLIDAGTWEVSNQIILKDKSGKKYVGRYLKQVPFELGEAYIANSSVTYLFAQKNKKFFDNAMEQITGDQFVVSEDRQDIDEDEDGYPDYDVDYSYFNTATIDDITEENGFAEIDCQWGAGRDG